MRDREVEFADGSLQRTRLEPVGVSIALIDALIGAGLDVAGSFEKHSGVEDHFGDSRKAIGEAGVKKSIDGFVA